MGEFEVTEKLTEVHVFASKEEAEAAAVRVRELSLTEDPRADLWEITRPQRGREVTSWVIYLGGMLFLKALPE